MYLGAEHCDLHVILCRAKGSLGFGEGGVSLANASESENAVNFCENEFLVAVFYMPDLPKVLPNSTSVGLTTGDRSRIVWYARTPFEQENILGRLKDGSSGHHQGFEIERVVSD